MSKLRRMFLTFSLLLAFSSLSCFSQHITTRAPDSVGMTSNYDFYIFWLNNAGWNALAMVFVNDTIHICPYVVHHKDISMAVYGHELEHYLNYISHGEVTDTSNQTKLLMNSDYWETPSDLKKIVYQGDDGSSDNKAIIIKKATTVREGIAAEYAYLEKNLGKRGVDWKPIGQYLHPFSNKTYDIIKVKIINTNKDVHPESA